MAKDKPKPIYRCANCKGVNIKHAVWKYINTGAIDESSAPVAKLIFCDDCEARRGDGEIRYIEEEIDLP
jgi:hypothetical protein